MPVTAKVAPHGQLAEQETVLREVDTIALNRSSDVSLDLHPRDIEVMTRQGDNLLVTLENGELITVENFYADPTELSHLYLQGDEFAGELFQVGLGEAGAGGAVPFTSTATLTTAETALTTAAAGAGTAGAEAATGAGAGAGAGISTAGLVAGGVAVAAGVGVAAATGDDSSSSDEDTTAPEAPVLDETNGNILTGSSEPGATIEVTNAAGDSVGSAVADADGNFSVELSPAQAAGTELTATATDAAGNVSEASTAVTVPQDADITAPNTPTIASATDDVEAITGALEDGDSTNDTTPTLGGTAEVGSTVTVTLDGEVIGTTTANSNGAWSFTPNTELGDGEHVFSVTATDAAGNASAPSGEFTLTVDTTAPDAPILSETDGETANGSTVNGSAEAGGTVEITNGDGDLLGSGTVADDGTFSITLSPKQDAGAELTATVTDAAGNESPVSDTLVVPEDADVTPPNTPTITSATDDVAADTGALASGDSTNDAAPTLIGSAEAGSSITITHNGEVVDSVTADANGAWSYTPSTDLTDGDHVFSVTATDAAGNESAPSGEFTLTVDTAAPDAPVLSETDGTTVAGTGEAGTSVEVTNANDDVLGTAVVDAEGNFSVELSPEQEAGSTLTATATDPAGNESEASAALDVPEDADVTAPNTPTITSATNDVAADTGALASGDSTNDATPTLTGSAEANSTVTITHNGEVVDTVMADANGSWSYTPSTDLTDDEHVFSVTATGAAGNESASSGDFTLTVDTTAPDAPILSETDGETANGSTVNGSAEAGGTVEITNGDGDLLGRGTVADDGTFSITLSPKQEAGAELTATVTDAAGNESAVSDTLVVPEDADVTAPNTPTIASATDDVEAITGALEDGDSTNDTTPILGGTAEVGSTVTVTLDGEVIGTTTADSNGAWSFTPNTELGDGEHVFSVNATDAAGNESAASGEFTLTVDTSAPNAPVLSETDGTTVAGTGEAGTTVEITNANDDVVGTAVVDAEGNFSVELSPEQEAGSTLTATATDAAGNESAASAALDVPEDADVTAPNVPTIASATDDVEAVTGTLASGDSTNDATPTLTGSAEAGSTVTITHNGEVVDSVTADANGAWRYTPSAELTEGDHVFSVTATDAAGNESAPSGEFTLTVDTTAPDAPVLSETDGETANGSTVNGSAEAGGTVEITNGDGDLLGSGTVADDGTFSITLSPKQEAGAVLTATVTDAAGNESPVSDPLVVPEAADVTAPNTPTIASATDDVAANTGALASGDSTNDATPTLTGSAEAGSTVTITHNGEVVDTVVADANGAWSYTPSTDLTDGEHVFSVTTTDAAGNESAPSGEFTLTVDTAAPDAPVLSETDGTTVAGTGEAGTTVEITNANDDVVGTAVVDAEGNFSVELSPEQEAGSTLTATATDAAGNESETSAALDVPVDADVTAPNTPTIASATDDVAANTGALASGDSTNDATPTLTGSAEAGSTVTITHNGEVVDTVVADANGAWSYTPSTDLTDGDHVFSVTATDAAGNKSAASGEFTLTVDTTVPSSPALALSNDTGTDDDGITSNGEVTVSDLETGATWEYTTDGGSNWIDGTGTTFTLAEGVYADGVVQIRQTDVAGNVSDAVNLGDVTVDATIAAPSISLSEDTNVTDDGITSNGEVTVSDLEADASWEYSLDGGSNWIAGTGTTFTLNEGVYADGDVQIRQTDVAGNVSDAVNLGDVTVDTTAPTGSIAFVDGDDGLLNLADISAVDLTGSIEAGLDSSNVVITITDSVDPANEITVATNDITVDGAGNLSVTGLDLSTATSGLTEGALTVSMTVTDVAGNTFETDGTTTSDLTVPDAPSLALSEDTYITNDGITSNGEVTVSGLEADATWEYSLDGGSNWIDGTGTTFTLDEGVYADGVVQIRQTDLAGNVSNAVNLGDVTVDATIAAPSLALSEDTNVTDDGITSNGEVTVSGLEADATWEYSLDGGSNWIGGTGTTFTLDEGVYADGDVQIRQTDVAGNVSTEVSLGAVTVDATIAAPSLALSEDTNITDDGITSNGEVTVSGLEADASWEYSLDGGSNWIAGTGTSFTLAEGVYADGDVQIRQTDVAGNVSDAVNLGAVTVDATIAAPSFTLSEDTNVTDDGITSNGEVTVSGLEADATWEYSLDGGSNWIDGTGTTFTLDEGVYADGDVQIRQTDLAGNVSNAVNLGDVTVDATIAAPSLALSEDTNVTDDGITSNGEVTVSGLEADASWEYSLDGGSNWIDGTGTTFTLAEGSYADGVVQIRQTDVAGNVSDAVNLGAVTVDATIAAPSLTLSEDTNVADDGITSNGEVTVSGLETDATWEVSLDGGTTWDAGTGTTFTLDEGSYADGTVQIRQTDVAGNVSDAVNLGAVTVDTTTPTGSIAFVDGGDGLLNLADINAVDLTGSIEAGLDSSNVVITITDSADPANEITVATTDITIDGAGNLSVTGLDLSTATSGLTEGVLTVSMTVTDVAGNTFETDGTTTSDLTAPEVPSLALTADTNVADDGITSNGEVTVSGLETDATWEVSLDGGTTWDAGTGTTFTLDEGSYADGTVQIRQTDVAGNVSDAVNLGAVTVNTTTPTGSIAFVDGGDGLLNLADINAVDLTGSIEAGLDSSNVVITITDSADPANEITVATTDITINGAGNLSVTGLDLSTATSGLTEGVLTISMTVTDVAGNTFETDGTTTSDLTAPEVPSLALTADTSVADDGITSNGEVTVSGLETDATWEVSLDGGTTWDAGTGTTFTLDEGVYADGVVQIRQTDLAGNVSDAVNLGAVTVDTTDPTGSIAFVDGADGFLNVDDITAVALSGSIEAGLDSSNVVITITDSAEPANEYTVDAGNISVGTDGALSVTGLDLSALTEGALTVSMTVTDVAGNTFETDGTTTSDLTAPEVPSLALTADTNVADDGITSNSEVTVSGLETDATWEVSLDGGTSWDAGTGTTFTLDEGVHADGVVLIRQTDLAGNVSDAVNLGAVTVDTTDPTGSIAFVDGADGFLNVDDITAVALSGSIEAGLDSSNVVITITDSAEPANEYTVDAGNISVGTDGALSVTGLDLSALTEGALTVSMTVTDVAGNTFETDGTTTSDLTAPEVPSLALTADTNVADDGITNNGEVTVSGLETDATWEVSLDGGTTWDARTGTTFTLDEGSYADGVVQIRQTDLAGNVSDAVNLGAVTVDTTDPSAPVITTISDNVGDLTADLVDGDSTDDTTPTVSGTAEADSSVTLYNGETVLGTDTADSDGNWSITPITALDEGDYAFTAIATDAAGNDSVLSNAIAITVDTTAPSAPSLAIDEVINGVNLDELTDGLQTTVTLSDEAVAGDTVTVTLVDSDDASNVITASVELDADDITAGNVAVIIAADDLTDGSSYAATAVITDVAGNRSGASNSIDVAIDITAPSAPVITTISDNVGDLTAALVDGDSTDDTTPTVSGTAEADSTVTLYNGETVLGTDTADSDGNWSITPITALDEGDYAFTAIATDTAGNDSVLSNAIAITVDTTAPSAPTLAITEALDGVNIDELTDGLQTTVTLSDEAVAGDTVTVTLVDSDDASNVITASVELDADDITAGNVAVIIAADDLTDSSSYAAKAVIIDVAGNSSDASNSIDVAIDITAPSAPVITTISDNVGDLTAALVDGDSTDDTTPTVSGTAEADSTVTLYNGETVLGTDTADSDGNWSITPITALDEGDYAFTAIATDAAGNDSVLSNAIAITVDTTAPGAPPSLVIGEALNGVNIDELTDGLQAEVALSADTVAGDTATVTLVDVDDADNVITADVELDETDIDAGTVAVTIPADTLTDGSSYNASAVITDAAGNVSNEVNLGTVTIDITAPATTVTIVSISDDTGLAADDFITNDDDGLTISATLDAPLAEGETLQYSTDGTTWVDITDSVTGTAVSYADADLTASATVQLKVQDAAGNDGAIESQDIVIDTTAPSGSVINFTDADGDDLNAAEATDVTFEGTVEAGLTSSNLTIVITDSDNGSVTVPTENITVSAAGEVTLSGVDLTGLAEGLLTVTMTVTDDAGNENVTAVSDTATKLSDDFLDLGNANRLTISEALIASAAGAVASTQTFADTSGEATLSLSSTESLTSNGQALDWVVTDEGHTLTLASDVDNAAATAVMVVSVTEDGTDVVYSAELLGNIDQVGAESSTVDVLVTLTDGDVSTSSTLNIDITDDVPTIAASTVVESLSSNTDYTGSIFDGGDDFGFGADAANGQVQSLTFKGLTFTVSDDGTYADVTGTSTEIGLEAGDTISIVDGILAVETLSGESFSLNIDSGDYSYSHQGQFSTTEEANTRPQANLTESDGVLGLVGVNVLDIVTLSNDQLYSVYDAEDNVASVTITADGIINTVTDYLDAISEALNALLDTLSLVPGVPTVSELIDILVGNSSWTYSEELAAELGLTVTASPSGESTQSITVTKIDGSEITNIEINELLASVDFTVSSAGILTGLLSLLDLDSLADSILSTTTIYATDSLAASSSDSDASIANVDLLKSDYVVPVDEGTTGNDSVNASQAGSNLYGYAGNDTLNGGSGSNILRGGNGDDTLDGGAGSDLLIGGSGNDSLNGGAGVDVIRWEAGDEGTVAAAATDTVLNFNNGGAGSGDILDLRDMLNGAYYIDSATNNLAGYISAEYVSATDTTVLYLNTEGGLTADPATSANQVININGLDLTEGGTLTSSEVIDSLIIGEQLLVGTEVNESDVSVTVVDGDGDTATGEVTFVGEESLDSVSNVAPTVTADDDELLGLLGLEALGLIDLYDSNVFVADYDNNLRSVVIDYSALVTIDVDSLITAPDFTWNDDLAIALGLSIQDTGAEFDGVLGTVAANAQITITAADGGDIDNEALNQLLATVTLDQGGINLVDVELFDALSITATNVYDAETTGTLSSLVDVDLLDSSSVFSGIDASSILVGGAEADIFDESDSATSVYLYGFAGNDVLTGGSASDVLQGGDGDDTLIGNLGDDYLLGGAGSNIFDGGDGDDTLVTSTLTFEVDGGAGIDTLSFDNTGESIDLTSLLDADASVNTAVNIEVLDISASSDLATTLTLDEVTVLNLTDDDNELYIDGDEGDSVEAAGATSSATTTDLNGTTYDTYQLGDATLYIDQDVTVNTNNG
ncbi:Ig-like domain-containing protein [Cobetia amphilecti]|uniref:Ig-like domain-containing protein n=1 Tax=Cobetia amphilecti TaxID=1055104 RepID=UPI0026E16312|nr:Ig-like domain-containing protein [Cobetia amphilecti]MDO6814530.1 Ig-like domain-containing protein [Cobetia amphilecti]